MIEHVYFFLDEVKDRIRIGHTDNLLRRTRDHQVDNFFRLKMLGIMDGGRPEEQAVHSQFEALRLPRESSRGNRVVGSSDEWFRHTLELRHWISANTRAWDGSDTFNWQSNIESPTLAMYGRKEWVAWVEEFAMRLGVEPGNLVEEALARLAERHGHSAPPPRITDQGKFPPAAATPTTSPSVDVAASSSEP